jgi:hypothetical protein
MKGGLTRPSKKEPYHMRTLKAATRHSRLALIAPVVVLALTAANLGVAAAATPASPETTPQIGVTRGGTGILPLCHVCGPADVTVTAAGWASGGDVTRTLVLKVENSGSTDASAVTVKLVGYGPIPSSLTFDSLPAHTFQTSDVNIICGYPIAATVQVGTQVVGNPSLFSGVC